MPSLYLEKFPMASTQSQKSSAVQLKLLGSPQQESGRFLDSIWSLEDVEIKTNHSLRANLLCSLSQNQLSHRSLQGFLLVLVDQTQHITPTVFFCSWDITSNYGAWLKFHLTSLPHPRSFLVFPEGCLEAFRDAPWPSISQLLSSSFHNCVPQAKSNLFLCRLEVTYTETASWEAVSRIMNDSL